MITATAEGRVSAAVRSPSRLLVLYDANCAFCQRCRNWLEHESTHVTLDFLAAGSDEARRRFGTAMPWLGEELVVVSDRGEVWVGPAAFLTCLWATKRYREWSYRLSGKSLAPLAERFFAAVSSRRATIARLVGPQPDRCADGRCRHRK